MAARHTLFLFHTRRPKEEGLVVEDVDANESSTHLVDPDPRLGPVLVEGVILKVHKK